MQFTVSYWQPLFHFPVGKVRNFIFWYLKFHVDLQYLSEIPLIDLLYVHPLFLKLFSHCSPWSHYYTYYKIRVKIGILNYQSKMLVFFWRAGCCPIGLYFDDRNGLYKIFQRRVDHLMDLILTTLVFARPFGRQQNCSWQFFHRLVHFCQPSDSRLHGGQIGRQWQNAIGGHN